MSESIARGRGTTKNTCPNCRRTVHLVKLENGSTLATDTELIAVVERGEHHRIVAHRVHAEQCDRYKLEDERARWRKEQQRRTKPTVREQRAHQKACNAARRAGQPAPRAPWDPAPPTAPPAATPMAPLPTSARFATLGEARRAVLDAYKQHEKWRASL